MKIKVREMKLSDWEGGLRDVLANLSTVERIPKRKYEQIFKDRRKTGHHTFVAEVDGQIVGTATLIVGYKLLRGGVRSGRVSDVATHPNWQRRGVGRALMKKIIKVAKAQNCYKLTLNCQEKNVEFYENFGFTRHEVSMRNCSIK